MEDYEFKIKHYDSKILYYQNIGESQTELADHKIKKYELKKAKAQKCLLIYDEKRIPSNCDRILYRGSISPIKYDIYNDDELIRKSDHLMVYGTFNFKEEKGIIFTWNIAKSHNSTTILEGIKLLIKKLITFNEDYIVFCLQESPQHDKFQSILIDQINLNNSNYKIICNSSNSLSGQNVRLIIFNKKIGVSLSDYKNCSNTIDNISSQVNYLDTFYKPNIFDIKKNILGTKAWVAITIDDLTFISCHLPIDTSIKDCNNYLGNNLRINALKKINTKLNNKNNIILAGDLNFRFIDDNTDQLNEVVKQDTNFKEFGKLQIKTCKLKSCK